MTSVIHGGDLHTASQRYNIPESDWIDLSTGLNPTAYPCENIPASAFSRMPYPSPEFKQAIKSYYGQHPYICVPGTQSIIEQLPKLLARLPVILPTIGYQEHHKAWRTNQNPLTYYDASSISRAEETIESQLKKSSQQHLLIINPNNPSGLIIPTEKLLDWSNQLSSDALLIVDEAFIDLTPESSLLALNKLPNNLVVLRSCGKFFGLAGIRAGFLFASTECLAKLEMDNSPWPINGPALHILEEALLNRNWHHASRQRIKKNAAHMQELFAPFTKKVDANKKLTLLANRGLFISYQGNAVFLDWLYEIFAKAGILLRVIAISNDSSILRVGLMDHLNKPAVERIRQCIEQVMSQSAFESFVQNRPRTTIAERSKPNS